MQQARSAKTSKLCMAFLVATTLLFAGCSAKVEGKSGAVKTSGAAAGDSSSGGGEGAEPLTDSELESVLPEAEDLGPDYEESSASSPSDAHSLDIGAAAAKACPASKKFWETNDGPDVMRDFETSDGRMIGIGLELTTPDDFRKMNEAARDAFAGCKSFSTSNAAGAKFQVSFELEDDSSVGDDGMKLLVTMKVNSKDLPRPITLKMNVQRFRVGDVGVTAGALSGFNTAAATEVDADLDIRDAVADDVAKKLGDLQN